MPRALQPSTPHDDIDARRRWTGPIIAGVLTQELADFCQSGVSVVIAARGRDGKPTVGVAKACRITPEGRMRVFLPGPSNATLLSALEQRAPVAITLSMPRDHRSIQIKALCASRVELEDNDLGEVARQVQAFASELVFVNYTPRFAAAYTGYRPEEIVAIEFSPAAVFVQTPGPGAGEQLA